MKKKKSPSMLKKHKMIEKHLKGDMKMFKSERNEDKQLLKKLGKHFGN